MNIKIDGTRVRTTSPYNPKMIKVLPHLEGMKRWGQNRSFSFENTPYNIKLWRLTFPEAEVVGELPPEASRAVQEAIFEGLASRPTFQFKTLPRAHQGCALAKFEGKAELPNVFALLMDIGTGKTWVGINVSAKLWCAGQIDGLLIVSKNGVHHQWVEKEIPKHMSDVVPWKAAIWGQSKRDEKIFNDVLSFDGLKIFAINIDALATRAAEDRILRFVQNCRGRMLMIADESQDIKNHSSLRTRAATKFGALCSHRMIMTGTPIAKNLVDAFSQFRFLDERIFGHKYLTTFRARYCVMHDNGYGPQIIGHKNVEEFYQTIDPHIFRITSEEVLDLPPKVYVEFEFGLSEEQKKIIKSLKQTFSAELADDKKVTATHAAAMLVKIQQVTCGFAVNEDGVVTSEFPNPRIEALKGVLEQREGKAIIWCRFQQDVRNVLQALGPSAIDYYGNTTTQQRSEHERLFLDPNSSIRYLVATPEAAGTGLNLQGHCQTNVYYSNSFNSLGRWQSEGRTWRDGTVGTVTYIDLIAKGGVDRRVLANLREKKSISDLALDELRKMMSGEDDEIFTP